MEDEPFSGEPNLQEGIVQNSSNKNECPFWQKMLIFVVLPAVIIIIIFVVLFIFFFSSNPKKEISYTKIKCNFDITIYDNHTRNYTLIMKILILQI